MSWTIQRIEPSEAARLVPLFENVHAIHAEARPDVVRVGPSRDELRTILEGMLNGEGMTGIAAVEAGGAILGYAICQVTRREAMALDAEGLWGVLHHIAVDPGRRRQGIGTALVEGMRTRLGAERVATMPTSYWACNHASAALMRKAGFVPHYVHAEAAV